MSAITIVFSHYGFCKYLNYTLRCARLSNPSARLIFLGDSFNKKIAQENGWEHYEYNSFKSNMLNDFNNVFRVVQGKKHRHIKNKKNWLKYVFERWFFVESFLEKESVEKFWHFDSDTMILEDLSKYDNLTKKLDFSVQCEGTCLNGYVTKKVVTEYCKYICDLFRNDVFLKEQQDEFDKINPSFAFTEMRAFDLYKSNTDLNWIHLLLFSDREVFDDCLMTDHYFKMTKLPTGEKVKDICFREGKVYGKKNGELVRFVSLNLSWLPNYLFEWVLLCYENKLDSKVNELVVSKSYKLFSLAQKAYCYIRGLIS